MKSKKIVSSKQTALTDETFWNKCYEGRNGEMKSFSMKDWKNYPSVQIMRKLIDLKLENNVLEIGGGDGKLICYLAKRYPALQFTVIEYSSTGCSRLKKRILQEGVKINVIQADLFSPPKHLIGYFDRVISHGLVEHFSNLSEVLVAKMKLLKPEGKMFTLIPNYAPIYRYFTKRWSPRVLNLHVLHDMNSFCKGHKDAGLNVLERGYLGSIEFGMLSMALNDIPEYRKFERWLYLWLTRISKGMHLMEYHFWDLPRLSFLAPFMFIMSNKKHE